MATLALVRQNNRNNNPSPADRAWYGEGIS